jgi:hypothetical protein
MCRSSLRQPGLRRSGPAVHVAAAAATGAWVTASRPARLRPSLPSPAGLTRGGTDRTRDGVGADTGAGPDCKLLGTYHHGKMAMHAVSDDARAEAAGAPNCHFLFEETRQLAKITDESLCPRIAGTPHIIDFATEYNGIVKASGGKHLRDLDKEYPGIAAGTVGKPSP